MHSFERYYRIKEDLDSQKSELKAIRNGLGIRESFWEDFLALLNNAEAVASLLNVSPEKVGTWTNLIKQGLKEVHDSDNEIVPKNKKRLLRTGLPEDL